MQRHITSKWQSLKLKTMTNSFFKILSGINMIFLYMKNFRYGISRHGNFRYDIFRFKYIFLDTTFFKIPYFF